MSGFADLFRPLFPFARSRTQAARSESIGWRIPFLPAHWSLIIWRQIVELWGGGLILGGVALTLALVSYSPMDPSWDTSLGPAAHIANWLGPWGAKIADVLRQGFGWTSLAFPLLLAAWGGRYLRAGQLRRPILRIIFAVFAVTALAAGLSALLMQGEPGMAGGAFGAALFYWIAYAVRHCFHIQLPLRAGGAGLTLAGLLSLKLASGISFRLFARNASEHSRPASDSWGWLSSIMRQAEDGGGPMSQEDGAPSAPMAFAFQEEPKKAAIIRAAKKAVARKEANPGPLRSKDGESLPPLELLQGPPPGKERGAQHDPETLRVNGDKLASVLRDFGVQGGIIGVQPGPVVTRYELEPSPGTRAARVIGLSDDIARSMSAASVRVAVIAGRNAIGIELPNARRELVYLRALLENTTYRDTSASLPLVLGRDIAGEPIIADLARMPHLLVAGTTGSGKSVAINTMILSLLYRLPPSRCRLIMVDPKMLELSVYEGIPHLLAPVVTEPKKAVVALKWVVREMEERYRAMSRFGVRNIDGYNTRLAEARKAGEILSRKVQTGFDAETGKPVFEEQAVDMTELPYIVVIVDEMADLMLVAGKEIETCIQRLAQMARAAGIHLIMATQRPSVDVITGTIKANFPTRISFQVTSKIDSRTILGEQGAEQLLGQGDMLYMMGGGRILRVHGPFVRDQEVEGVATYLRKLGEPSYIDAITADQDEDGDGEGGGEDDLSGNSTGADALYDRAVDLVLREGKASTSFLQRHLQLGYNRAARLIDRMEAEGLVTPANHVGKREILGRRAG